ncbi:hypothetical protein OLMES_3364 [Oleiphilus messinensis]|uniref:Uncharacterized protein n=1 Tax=Oleiphilus messinensis TaxID=141451 RepID=A0A1Y0IA53_9GAMM|nr:hypothetical protein OLMES_3364 [Oleiphilus messinensis]
MHICHAQFLHIKIPNHRNRELTQCSPILAYSCHAKQVYIFVKPKSLQNPPTVEYIPNPSSAGRSSPVLA